MLRDPAKPIPGRNRLPLKSPPGSVFTVVYGVPKRKVNVCHRHEGGEAGQDFGFPIGAKRLEFEVSLQPETQGHHDMLAAGHRSQKIKWPPMNADNTRLFAYRRSSAAQDVFY